MQKFYSIFFSVIFLAIATPLFARKAAYSGFGKVSKSTGRIKIKTTSGHFKRSTGYKFVNPYSRS